MNNTNDNSSSSNDSSSSRKVQLAEAQRKYKFAKIVDLRVGKGITYSLPKDALIELFCNQEKNERVTGSVFLKSYVVFNDDSLNDLNDSPLSDDSLNYSSDSLNEKTDSTNYVIPLETSQTELIELLVNFFRDKDLLLDHIKSTVNRLMDFYPGITVSRNVNSEEDLSRVIRKFIDETEHNVGGVAEAILNGLTAGEGLTNDNVSELLTIMYRNHTASTGSSGGE